MSKLEVRASLAGKDLTICIICIRVSMFLSESVVREPGGGFAQVMFRCSAPKGPSIGRD